MQRVREGLAQVTRRGDAPAFTSSFGIAQSNDADDIADLVQRADAAVFAAKDAGRDRICLDGHTMPVAPTTLAALAWTRSCGPVSGSALVDRAGVRRPPTDRATHQRSTVARAAASGEASGHQIAGV